ncbi:MAG: stage 0 sporulation family protein [Halanaerobiales bacterium]|nr:stage 0 sporulation family protein [Halanaerobiales bacterium]
MKEVIGISFKRAGKIYYFDPDNIEVEIGDKVIVETSRGVEMGDVVLGKKKVEEKEIVAPLKSVIRKANLKDKARNEKNKKLEEEAFDIALDKIEEHGLPMKLIDVEYTFDHNKVIFYFTADGRVDFRELVKDLARIFKTRIELRQIGVRDEAKMIGGIGPCGRRTCCDTFLRDFDPISIQLAKDQELALNPAKISGLCGRLMCCLKYENEYYEEITKKMPEVGEKITLSNGSKAKVVNHNLIKQEVKLKNKDGDLIKFSLEEIEKIKENQ